MDFTILAIPGAAVLRSLAGWVENALEDGKVTKYEWAQLGATLLRVVPVAIGFMYGLDFGVFEAAGAAVLTDIGISAVKKAGTA